MTDCPAGRLLRSCGDQRMASDAFSAHMLQAMFFSVWWASYITPPFIRRAIEYLFVCLCPLPA